MNEILNARIKKLAHDNEEYVIALRREFHMNPEPAYEEERTSGVIQYELKKMGIAYEVLEDRTVIGVIKGNQGGKTIAIRGDIDALRIQDEKSAPYKSQNAGIMHACGHDAHGAMLLGIAKMLAELKKDLKGTVKLIFQVAEEVSGGYKTILEYLEKTGGVDRVIATHLWAGLDTGMISIESGPVMAGNHHLHIEVTGCGGHASRPDQAINPIFPLCDIIMKLPYVPQYFHNALEASVVSIGTVHAGTTFNIIPDKAKASGGVRFFTTEAKEAIQGYICNLAEHIAKAYGAEAKVSFPNGIEPVVNDETSVKLAREVVHAVEGLRLVPYEQICASDCYGMILRKYPGCYCFMGIRNEEKGIIYPQHHAKYDIDESVMRLNCEFMCKYAVEYLTEHK